MINKRDYRIIYLDYLRVFAAFSVVALHLTSYYWIRTQDDLYIMYILNFYDAIVRFGVPIFLMISGALLLNRDISIKALYYRYVLKMIIAFLTWSSIYNLRDVWGGTAEPIVGLLKGHYHMWYIPMITGIYMCIPFIKNIIKENAVINYFLLIALIFIFILPELNMALNDFSNAFIGSLSSQIYSILDSLNIGSISYASYFVLGYWISKIEIKTWQRVCIYFFGAGSVLLTAGLDLVVAGNDDFSGVYYGNFSINILLEAIAVFILFRYKKYKNEKVNLLIRKLSRCCFGIYLVHPLIIEILDGFFGLNKLRYNPIYMIPVFTLFIFMISFGITLLIKKIPIIKNWVI